MAPPHSETVASQGGIARPAKRTFTWQQLSAHNKEGDAYVGIHGNVYNVTEWMAVHPGGKDVLLVAAGRDVSQVRCTAPLTGARRKPACTDPGA